MFGRHINKLQLISLVRQGDTISMAASLANYEVMLDPEMDLMGRAAKLGRQFQDMIRQAQRSNEIIGEVRGLGLLQAIELVKDPRTKAPVDSTKLINLLLGPAAARGLWIVPAGRYGNVIRFMPPLTIVEDHFIKSVEIIIDVLNENKDDLSR